MLIGSIYYPPPWTSTSDCTPDMRPNLCKNDVKIPSTNCTRGSNGCSHAAGRSAWFTNFTFVSERTIENEMLDVWGKFKSNGAKLHPWNSPGAAPIFGNGCGVNGGNPNGCDNEGQVLKIWLDFYNCQWIDFLLGRCCGGNARKGKSCGGYVGGKPALKHYREGFWSQFLLSIIYIHYLHEGLFGRPKFTTWKRGGTAEVFWKSGMKHRGGYAYRLCKVENGKVWRVTEKCFQNGHLKFAGIWFKSF